MLIWLKLKFWQKMIPTLRLLSWYYPQDTILANIFTTSSGLSSTALHRFPWHELSSKCPVPPLQQWLKRELVNEKLRETVQHAEAMTRDCRSLHVHPTKTQYVSTDMRSSISRGPSSLCSSKSPPISNKNQLKASRWCSFYSKQQHTQSPSIIFGFPLLQVIGIFCPAQRPKNKAMIDLSLGREGTRIEGALTLKVRCLQTIK